MLYVWFSSLGYMLTIPYVNLIILLFLALGLLLLSAYRTEQSEELFKREVATSRVVDGYTRQAAEGVMSVLRNTQDGDERRIHEIDGTLRDAFSRLLTAERETTISRKQMESHPFYKYLVQEATMRCLWVAFIYLAFAVHWPLFFMPVGVCAVLLFSVVCEYVVDVIMMYRAAYQSGKKSVDHAALWNRYMPSLMLIALACGVYNPVIPIMHSIQALLGSFLLQDIVNHFFALDALPGGNNRYFIDTLPGSGDDVGRDFKERNSDALQAHKIIRVVIVLVAIPWVQFSLPILGLHLMLAGVCGTLGALYYQTIKVFFEVASENVHEGLGVRDVTAVFNPVKSSMLGVPSYVSSWWSGSKAEDVASYNGRPSRSI